MLGPLLATACEIRTILGQTMPVPNCSSIRSYPSVIREGNELPRHVQDSPTLLMFKNHLNSNISSQPSYYYTGNRPSQIYHTRISALNQHLFS